MVIRWIRSILSSSKKLVGTDHLGNKYYEALKGSGKVRRFVESGIKPEEYTTGQIPHEWEAWIRGKRSDPPLREEIEKHLQYTAVVQKRAAQKAKEDDQRQAEAYAEGLITRERPVEDTPARQAMTSESVKKSPSRATSGTSYEPEHWSPGSPTNDSTSVPENDAKASTPGGKS